MTQMLTQNHNPMNQGRQPIFPCHVSLVSTTLKIRDHKETLMIRCGCDLTKCGPSFFVAMVCLLDWTGWRFLDLLCVTLHPHLFGTQGRPSWWNAKCNGLYLYVSNGKKIPDIFLHENTHSGCLFSFLVILTQMQPEEHRQQTLITLDGSVHRDHHSQSNPVVAGCAIGETEGSYPLHILSIECGQNLRHPYSANCRCGANRIPPIRDRGCAPSRTTRVAWLVHARRWGCCCSRTSQCADGRCVPWPMRGPPSPVSESHCDSRSTPSAGR